MLYQPACHTAPNWEMSTLGDQGIATLSEIVAFTLHFLNRRHLGNTYRTLSQVNQLGA